MVTIEQEFRTAYAAAGTADVARPELLPVRLARACARVLPVAGVGISMYGSDGIRIPVGASDDDASIAERLQFTAAEGPCLDAQAIARSVLATESLIEQRWPDFYTGLVTRTPFRAVAAIPWSTTLRGAGTVDLLFHHSRDLADLDIGKVDEVIARVEHTLVSEKVLEFSRLDPGPAWLAGAGGGVPERGVHRDGHADRRVGRLDTGRVGPAPWACLRHRQHRRRHRPRRGEPTDPRRRSAGEFQPVTLGDGPGQLASDAAPRTISSGPKAMTAAGVSWFRTTRARSSGSSGAQSGSTPVVVSCAATTASLRFCCCD